jgi:hypothetical protein
MSHRLCIRSCGRRRTLPSLLCVQCRDRELEKQRDRTGRLKRPMNSRQRQFYGIPPRLRRDEW